MRLVYSQVAFSSASLVQEPEVGESGRKRTRNVSELPVTNIWEQVVKEREERDGYKGVWGEEDGKEHLG